MECGVARRHIYLKGPESGAMTYPVEAETAQAEAHVAHCQACREFFSAEERLSDYLKRRAPQESASASFREKLLSSIARERQSSSKQSRLFDSIPLRGLVFGLASLLVIAVAAVLWLSHRRAGVMPQQLASSLIDDHAHSFAGQAEVASSSHNVVQSWFDGKLDFSFHLPPASDSSLVGGRLCNLQGRRAALIFYQQPQGRISLFVFDGGDVAFPDDRLIAIDGKRCMVDAAKGYNAVLWKERGVVYGLVSDARSTDLLQLAAQF